ncbi:uncharacterized protein B0I36DRAFT_341813 [Microdochium trichocladiopsis]|uniref:Uncharacterized protein n=1 Tax=Microdochium trichocladiopsis TaxID=1682393 RepID=A0A9P8XQ70_9PEZI|nr:uncharacterized protein B0I36DRAFT_341813 [Microdochium trichocladiopsis]KAH7010631.1 hypothetical protein B0I36DRAFT_341813 [Microdochium trichocladiopsis]
MLLEARRIRSPPTAAGTRMNEPCGPLLAHALPPARHGRGSPGAGDADAVLAPMDVAEVEGTGSGHHHHRVEKPRHSRYIDQSVLVFPPSHRASIAALGCFGTCKRSTRPCSAGRQHRPGYRRSRVGGHRGRH